MPRSARVLRKHRRGCFAVDAVKRGDWEHPWATLDDRDDNGVRQCAAYWATASGAIRRHGGGTYWLRFRCNDPKCPALLGIRADTAIRAALAAGGAHG